MIAYIDFFLGGDEKRMDMVTSMQNRFPMSIFFGGDGSYMSPYNLDSDTLLTNLFAPLNWGNCEIWVGGGFCWGGSVGGSGLMWRRDGDDDDDEAG